MKPNIFIVGSRQNKAGMIVSLCKAGHSRMALTLGYPFGIAPVSNRTWFRTGVVASKALLVNLEPGLHAETS
jgi:hypothetical protein